MVAVSRTDTNSPAGRPVVNAQLAFLNSISDEIGTGQGAFRIYQSYQMLITMSR